MISASLLFSLQATPCGELDLWQEFVAGSGYIPRTSGRNVRRTIPPSSPQERWANHAFVSKPLNEFCKKLFQEFGIKHDGSAHGTVNLESPNLAAFYQRLIELRETVSFASGIIRFELFDDEITPCEWFILSPRNKESDSISGRFTDNECCRTDQMPNNTHAVDVNFVSEDFKRAVEKHGFTGVEFIWLPDTSKRPRRQWFRIIAQKPIGRGIDHDWFDSKTLTGEREQSAKPLYRRGINDFQWKQAKKEAGFGDSTKDGLISLFPPNTNSIDGLNIQSFNRLLRSALPKTDFAFIWQEDFREACFSRRVKEALINEGVLTAEQCDPILIVDAPPPEVLVLDGTHPCPPAYEPVERLETVRAKTMAAWLDFSARRPPQLPPPSLNQALDLLHNSIREGRNKFESPTTIKSIQQATKKLPIKVPEMWCKVLSEANGAVIYGVFGDLGFSAAEYLEGHYEEFTRRGIELDPEFPRHLLHFAFTGSGDFLSLDTSKVTADGDCPVVLMSHETYEPDRTWPSIPEFLAEVFEPEQGED